MLSSQLVSGTIMYSEEYTCYQMTLTTLGSSIKPIALANSGKLDTNVSMIIYNMINPYVSTMTRWAYVSSTAK